MFRNWQQYDGHYRLAGIFVILWPTLSVKNNILKLIVERAVLSVRAMEYCKSKRRCWVQSPLFWLNHQSSRQQSQCNISIVCTDSEAILLQQLRRENAWKQMGQKWLEIGKNKALHWIDEKTRKIILNLFKNFQIIKLWLGKGVHNVVDFYVLLIKYET